MKLVLRDEYLRNLILRYVVDTYREDLRKLLGLSFAGIKLEWSEDFENFLSERKKRGKVRDPETISYYRSLFKKMQAGGRAVEMSSQEIITLGYRIACLPLVFFLKAFCR
ncbi:MAG: hypothetical protein QXI94_02830 [Sulfolobales archaeon]